MSKQRHNAVNAINMTLKKYLPGFNSGDGVIISEAIDNIIAEAVRQAVEKIQPITGQDDVVSELAQQLAAANDEIERLHGGAKSAWEEREAVRKQRDEAWDEIDELRHMLRLTTQSKTSGYTTYDKIREYFTHEQAIRVLKCLEEFDELEELDTPTTAPTGPDEFAREGD